MRYLIFLNNNITLAHLSRVLIFSSMKTLLIALAIIFPDFDGNGTCDFADFLLFAQNFGSASPAYDLDQSGDVGFSDFLIFVQHFGERDPSTGFNIEVAFIEDHGFTQREIEIIESAARRWEEVIVGDLPDKDYSSEPYNDIFYPFNENQIFVGDVVDDVRIFFGNIRLGDLAGQAGPQNTWYSYDPDTDKFILDRLPSVGYVALDAGKFRHQENTDYWEGHFYRLSIHEIGHVLGIGSLWGNFVTKIGDLTPLYGGPLAVKAFSDSGGKGKIPLEQDTSHWKEQTLGDEVMTPRPSQNFNTPLSAVTVQALADLGYVVDVSKADRYRVPKLIATSAKVFGCSPLIPVRNLYDRTK